MINIPSSKKKGKEIIKDVFYFNENPLLDCNQFIIQSSTSEELILFDAGNGKSLEGLIKGMEELGLDFANIRQVYLTHEHVDHVLGLYPLINLLKNDPPKIFAYGETAKILQEGSVSKIFPGNLGISPAMFNVKIQPLKINDLINLKVVKISDDFTFQIFHTPGHSEGSITYYEPNKKILIPGDLVFSGGSFGRYDFPGGSLNKLTKSIEFVNNLDVKYLLPGHMNISIQGNEEIAKSYRIVQSITTYF